jgi:hypothetical protein
MLRIRRLGIYIKVSFLTQFQAVAKGLSGGPFFTGAKLPTFAPLESAQQKFYVCQR